MCIKVAVHLMIHISGAPIQIFTIWFRFRKCINDKSIKPWHRIKVRKLKSGYVGFISYKLLEKIKLGVSEKFPNFKCFTVSGP